MNERPRKHDHPRRRERDEVERRRGEQRADPWPRELLDHSPDLAIVGDRAKKYVPNGAGAVLTFGLKGGYDAGVKLVSNVKLFSHLANIGDTRSLIIHPASTTHRQLSDAQKIQAGAGPDVVRLSVGIEDKDDIIADLEQGLKAK